MSALGRIADVNLARFDENQWAPFLLLLSATVPRTRTGVTDLQHQIVWHFIAFPHMLLVDASREFIAKMRGRRVRCITWAGAAIASNEFGVNANVTHKALRCSTQNRLHNFSLDHISLGGTAGPLYAGLSGAQVA